jgi:hypothetical protein
VQGVQPRTGQARRQHRGAAPSRTLSVQRPRVLGRALRKERDRARPADMATQDERILRARERKTARQRQSYRERRQALLDAFPYLAQRKVSLHRAGTSCTMLDRWRDDDDPARRATESLRDVGVSVGAAAAGGCPGPGAGASGEGPSAAGLPAVADYCKGGKGIRCEGGTAAGSGQDPAIRSRRGASTSDGRPTSSRTSGSPHGPRRG